MSFADLAVFFVTVFEFLVERSKEVLGVFHIVAESLACAWDEERVSKVIFASFVGGCAPTCETGGRTARRKKKTYDCTKEYPVEDVAEKLPCFL